MLEHLLTKMKVSEEEFKGGQYWTRAKFGASLETVEAAISPSLST
jgi:hypothetical protein